MYYTYVFAVLAKIKCLHDVLMCLNLRPEHQSNNNLIYMCKIYFRNKKLLFQYTCWWLVEGNISLLTFSTK